MSSATAACKRCGRDRAVKPERGVPALCGDCSLVEPNWPLLADPRCGTHSGYQTHLREHTIPCDRCLAAERERGRRQRRARGIRPRTAQPCGTNAGYHRHRYRHEKPCDPCKTAHADAWRTYRTGRSADESLPVAA